MASFMLHPSQMTLPCLRLFICSINSFFFKSFIPPSGIWNSIWHVGHRDGSFETVEDSKHFRQKLWAQGNSLGSIIVLLQTAHISKDKLSITQKWSLTPMNEKFLFIERIFYPMCSSTDSQCNFYNLGADHVHLFKWYSLVLTVADVGLWEQVILIIQLSLYNSHKRSPARYNLLSCVSALKYNRGFNKRKDRPERASCNSISKITKCIAFHLVFVDRLSK